MKARLTSRRLLWLGLCVGTACIGFSAIRASRFDAPDPHVFGFEETEFGTFLWGFYFPPGGVAEACIWLMRPASVLFLCFSMYGLAHGFKKWRKTQKDMKHGFCRHCGYDLRESVGRCPECGKSFVASTSLPIRAKTPSASLSHWRSCFSCLSLLRPFA